MKKVLLPLLLIAAIVLTACGPSIPQGMNKETYNLTNRALEILEKYNSGDLDLSSAADRIDQIRKEIENLKIDDNLEDINNRIAKTKLSTIALTMKAGTGSTYSAEEELKEFLGK